MFRPKCDVHMDEAEFYPFCPDCETARRRFSAAREVEQRDSGDEDKPNENAWGYPEFAGNTKPSNPKDALGIGKVPSSVIPLPVSAEVGVGMLEGALKYGRHNYRAIGVRGSVYYDATRRHLDLWWEGEDNDPEGVGLSHITKAITSLVVLRDAMIQENWVDDRPPPTKTGWMNALNEKVKALLLKYPNPVAPYIKGGRG